MTKIEHIPVSDSDLESSKHVPINGHRLKSPTSATYKKINFDNGAISYVLNDEDNESNIINYGNVSKNDSNDYFVAYVNKRTKDVLYKPVSLVKLQSRLVKNKNKFFSGKILKENTKADYKNSSGFKKEQFLEKRNALTTDFGSIKKRKMLDDVVRRNVDQDTMTALADTAFASTTNVDEKPNLNQSGIEALNAIGGTIQGDVLPKYNPNGKKPLEIWPIEQFIDDSTYDLVSENCLEFFQNKSCNDLENLGFPKLIIDLVQQNVKCEGATKTLYLLMKLHYMVSLYVICKGAKTVDPKKVSCSGVPEILVNQVNSEFLDVSKMSKFGNIPHDTTTKDKIASRIIILYMILNAPSHSIYINIASKQFHISEQQMIKYLNKLGCVINKATSDEQLNYGAIRVGVLKNPPGSRIFSSKRKR
ncbi:RNA polymerase I associated factor, A49-like family-containing protein [Strongyloides ratti]|uniref:RNA polymerase I associated factor, A49-like family-containing protein n=1 Tax=Strongyloides ratti TaxID=34506 RepID=A0A090MWZ0_STRRB|nr:RNA polymerase I associated factor, A49-like family-containing protein [Strongyloides ratti]CEF64519.1 RNA polymerase I associated factor, A49-like family-containing protein [Strongyloides ratti]